MHRHPAPAARNPGAVGLIGLGEIGQVHAAAVRRSRSARRVAVADTVPELLLPFEEQGAALGEQRNGEWRYLEFLQVTSLIAAGMFMREIPGGTTARHRSRPADLPEHRY